MVEAHKMKHRGVQIMHVHSILYRLESKLVGRAVYLATANTTTGHPHSEPIVIMIATGHGTRVGSLLGKLHGRRAPELASPNHQRLLEQPQTLQIRQQGRDWLVTLTGQLSMLGFDMIMIIPRLPIPMPDLYDRTPRSINLRAINN